MRDHRNKNPYKSRSYVIGGVIFSVLFHTAFFVIFSWPSLTKNNLSLDLREKEHTLQINLRSSDLNHRPSEKIKYSKNKQVMDYSNLSPKSYRLEVPIYSSSHEDPKIATALQLIQERVVPIWQKDTPPEMGEIVLRMKLDTKGRIASLWTIQVHGSQMLAEYIKNLLRQAAPFCKAMEGFSRPLILDCLFHIAPKTAQSINEG